MKKQPKGTWRELPEQLLLPRIQRGVDYGTPRPVLAQRGNHALVLQPGQTYTAGIGCREYAPATYVLCTMDGTRINWGNEELWSGRLSKARLAAAAPRIAAWLGCTVEDLPAISRRKTFVWLFADEPEFGTPCPCGSGEDALLCSLCGR